LLGDTSGGTEKPEVESQFLRTLVGQGLGFGFGDEIEAAVRAALPGEERGYEEIRDALRQQLAAYKQDNPTVAISAEIAGALIPTAISLIATGGTAAPLTAARLAKIGATQGAATGLGTSEADNIVDMGLDVGTGAAIGGVASPLVPAAGKYVAQKASGLVDFAKRKYGSMASNAVQAELRRLQDQTGKSVDQIVDDLESGRLMSDNRSLLVAMKGYVTEGGKAGQMVKDKYSSRLQDVRQEAMEESRAKLAPDMEQNITRGFKETEEDLLRAEGQAYDEIFATVPDTAVTKELTDDILLAARSVPNALETVNSLYSMQKLVPLFKTSRSGAIEFARQPTLKDAELVRRGLASRQDVAFRQGEGEIGKSIKDIQNRIRGEIDDISGELKATRANYAEIKSARKAYDEGRKALNPSTTIDDIEIIMDRIASKPEQLKAFKAGMMASINAKSLSSNVQGMFRNLSNDQTQMGQAIRAVLSPDEIASLEAKFQRATDVGEISSRLPEGVQSITAPLQKEMQEAGTRLSLSDFLGALVDPSATASILRTGAKLIRQKTPMLTDNERTQVVQILFEKDPVKLRKALSDQKTFDELMNKYSTEINRAVRFGERAARTGLVRDVSRADFQESGTSRGVGGLIDLMGGP
jgi:hypothetical protein